MSDEWEFYFCTIDNSPASIFVDVGLEDSVPDEARPHCAEITVFLLNPTEQGLTTDEEADTLWKIEEALVRKLRESNSAELVGRVTMDGARSFYFYAASDEDMDDRVFEVLDQFPQYEVNIEVDYEPEWDAYFQTLFPAPIDWQQIFDRQLVEQLIESGDPLTPPREVAHYLYFNSTEGREQFAEQVQTLGFEVTDQAEHPEEEDHPHGIRIVRGDPVVMDHIHGVTRELMNNAAILGGIYDGWECPVLGPEFQ
jgi:uncharacterized protein (TIGR01619 family)